ncbi:MAG TPA: PaaI family thioesterase [Burkholderiaceae bacterium]|nr:PaaI family thioesterase [Burkholderiaceae bacterium]
MRLLGVEVERVGEGASELSLSLREEHENSWGVAHGGVIMALLDVAMARAGRSLAEGEGRPSLSTVTVEMKTTFFRPARGRLLARGRVLHRSTTMTYCEGEIVDDAGQVFAKASGTFKFLARPDAAARVK